MLGKYFYCLISLVGLTITPASSTPQESVECLLKNTYWEDIVAIEANAGIMDDLKLIKISDIIAKDADGNIVNENNLPMKIRHLFTLMSAVYSDRLKIITLYLKAITVHSNEANVEWNTQKFIPQQIKHMKPVLFRMKSSLKLLSNWYFKYDKKRVLMNNNKHIVRALASLLLLFECLKSFEEFIEQLNNIYKLLEEFQANYLRHMIVNSYEIIEADIQNEVRKYFEKGPDEAKEMISNQTASFVRRYTDDIKCFGFEYFSILKTSFVKGQFSNSLKSNWFPFI